MSHAGLGNRTVPTQRADLVHAELAGLDDEVAGVDHRLQDRHGAIIEEEGVVVVRRTTEQLDVPRLGIGEAGLEAVDQRGGLQKRRP